MALGLILTAAAFSGLADLPQYAEEAHVGVGECASGPCHGSARPVGDRVNQNEHTIWLRANKHSKAYKSLLSERGASIARNLGLPKDAQESPECLDCHADHASVRESSHRLEDGVGCEACHGGAQNWLRSHTSPTRLHRENLARGMYPTDQAVARAELCVSCHFGDQRKFVSHRMMGAGHPRLRFELDSFSSDQPPHHKVDADYRERGKAVAESAKIWAIGQAVIAREMVGVIADPMRNHDGIWPEFAVLDCYGCHHAIGRHRRPASTVPGLPLRPGTPGLNDSMLIMLRSVLETVDPKAAEELRRETRALHAALRRGVGPSREVARRMERLIDSEIPQLALWQVTPEAVRSIITALIDEGRSGAYRKYLAAEQVMLAIQSLAVTLHEMEPLDRATLQKLQQGINALASAVAKPDEFRTREFTIVFERTARTLID